MMSSSGTIGSGARSDTPSVAEPDPAVYELTVRRRGAQPHEIFFMDGTPLAVDGVRTVS